MEWKVTLEMRTLKKTVLWQKFPFLLLGQVILNQPIFVSKPCLSLEILSVSGY